MGDTSEHERFKMGTLIQGNEFVDVSGQNNKGTPGGELISIKASTVTAKENTFTNCIGQLSLRGGVGNIADGNTFTGGKKNKGGIQVYGNKSQILNNILDNKAVIQIGSGESNCAAGKQPFGDHLPATEPKLKAIKAGASSSIIGCALQARTETRKTIKKMSTPSE